jgi:hypothetical protein
MPKVKQISAWIDDRPGLLGELARALGARKVDIRAFMASVLDGKGFIRLVVDRPAEARKVLAAAGWKTTVDELVEVVIPDRPGAMGRVADRLGAAGINIHYGYVGSSGKARTVSLFLAVEKPARAIQALRD